MEHLPTGLPRPCPCQPFTLGGCEPGELALHAASVPKSQSTALSPGDIYQIVATKKPS